MNVIYLNPDQMRADFLGCYGHPVSRTPHIDRLAAEGTRFDQCHVQHTVCTPSRCSFMTGWYPHVRGHRTLANPLRADEPNTLRYLKQAGYDVHWSGKNDLLAPEAFAQSVSRLHLPKAGSTGERGIFPKEDPGYWSFLYGPMQGHHADWQIVDGAVDFLRSRRKGDSPFMLYLPLDLPHAPFTCPQPWYDRYDPECLDKMRSANLPGKPDFYKWIREYRQLDKLDPKVLRKIRAVYLGMIAYVDAMIGRLLNALETTGLAENTAVFLFSDHGEWAGDYGLVEKWHSALDDCLTRVPMIARIPGGKPGHVVSEPIECFDIMPTTLELAGVEPRHTHFARSMIPQIRDGAAGDPERTVFAEGGYDPHEPHCFEGSPDDIAGQPEHIYFPKGRLQQDRPESSERSVMARTASMKLIYRGRGQSELYDLIKDPDELENRYTDPQYDSVRRELEGRLLNWYLHTSDVTPMDRQPRHYVEEVRRKFGRTLS